VSKDKKNLKLKNHQKYGNMDYGNIEQQYFLQYTIYEIEELLYSTSYTVTYLGFCLVGEGGYDIIQ